MAVTCERIGSRHIAYELCHWLLRTFLNYPKILTKHFIECSCNFTYEMAFYCQLNYAFHSVYFYCYSFFILVFFNFFKQVKSLVNRLLTAIPICQIIFIASLRASSAQKGALSLILINLAITFCPGTVLFLS